MLSSRPFSVLKDDEAGEAADEGPRARQTGD